MILSQRQRRGIRYILLEKTEVRANDQNESYQVPRGEILEEVYHPDIDSGVIALFDERRQLPLFFPTKLVARLTDFQADSFTSIMSLEDRYDAFQARNRFENTPRTGSDVFVAVKGREFCGIVMHTPFLYNGEVVSKVQIIDEAEVKKYGIPGEICTTLKLDEVCRLPTGGIGVLVSVDKLRPRYSGGMEFLPRNSRSFLDHQTTFYHQEAAARRGRAYEDKELKREELDRDFYKLILKGNSRRGILSEFQGSFHQISKKEKFSDEKEANEFEALLIKEKRSREELEKRYKISQKRLTEVERQLALQSQAYEEIKSIFNDCCQRSFGLESALKEQKHVHEKTNELLKQKKQALEDLEVLLASTQKDLEEKEEDLINSEKVSDEFERELTIEQEARKELETRCERAELTLKEFERQLACEQNIRKDTENQLLIYKQTSKELETTLASAQKSLKKTLESEKQCDWILSREEIHLTEEKLGSGTFGTVYKGTFRGTDIAVKKVKEKPIITEYNEKNFRREMKMAARCRHPCMLQFIGATSDDEIPLLVTELLDTSLKDILLERALEPTEIKTVALDVAKGLNYLHLNYPNPIVHRDISSGNVLLWKHGESWRGKVSDYGNAVLMNYSKTGSGGAFPYRAPEIDNQRFSTKSDVYSYGVLMLEMCLREEPSCFDDRDALICLVKNGTLRSLIRNCLQQDLKQRPSMDEIITILNGLTV